jgi:hypothetical protein
LQVYSRVSYANGFIQRGVCDLTELTEPAYCAELTDFPTMAPTVTPPTPMNDLCIDAKSILPGTTTSGSSLGATFDDVGFCGTINSSPGVWYKIVGDGASFKVDTCEFASFDTRISIFEGSCASLECLTGNDQALEFDCFTTGASRVTFPTVLGTTYYILVHGNFERKGMYSGALLSKSFSLARTGRFQASLI